MKEETTYYMNPQTATELGLKKDANGIIIYKGLEVRLGILVRKDVLIKIIPIIK